MQEIGRTFEVWRYAYEDPTQTGISVTFLGGVTNSAIAVLQQDVATNP